MTRAERLRGLVQRQWQRGGWLSGLLLPLSGLTWLAVRGKRLQYARGWKQAWRSPVPVVVVGNILAGGTGKTPVVMAVVRALQARGWRPGVVSRGYGVDVGPEPRVARGAPSPAEIGDEPALIAAGTGVPVAVHPRRPQAAQALLRAWPDTDVIVSDDGLQHLALGRDVEIAVQDARGTGNGRLLPAGPLREPAARLQTVDAIVSNITRATGGAGGRNGGTGADAHGPDKKAADTGIRADAGEPPRICAQADRGAPRRTDMRLSPDACVRLHDGLRLSPDAFRQAMAGKRVAAAAGIGQPERFFATVTAAGIALSDTLALPDHYGYQASPFGALDADAILVTTKDAVKCAALDDARLWAVEVSPVFSDPGFFDWLDGRLRAVPAQGAADGPAA